MDKRSAIKQLRGNRKILVEQLERTYIELRDVRSYDVGIYIDLIRNYKINLEKVDFALSYLTTKK